jgi:hypothetical protein
MTILPFSVKEGYHRTSNPDSIGNILEDLESVYGFSARRLWDHALRGEILGISYDHGQWCSEGNPRMITGPIPAKNRDYLKPKGSEAYCVVLASGTLVSSTIWCHERQKTIILRADISGTSVSLTYSFNLSATP